MSEVERVVKVGLVALREDGADLKSVAAALLEEAAYAPAKTVAAPATTAMTDELVRAVALLPAYFASRQIKEVRKLTEAEMTSLGQEQDVIDAILKPLAARRESIKDAVKNHMDLVAVDKGLVTDDTVRDAYGHVVVATKGNPEQVAIPGTARAWSREFRAGTVEIDTNKWLDMYESGEIDRDTYLKFTKAVRVFDEDKAFAAMAKDPGLLTHFRKIIKRGRPSTALFIRKLKK